MVKLVIFIGFLTFAAVFDRIIIIIIIIIVASMLIWILDDPGFVSREEQEMFPSLERPNGFLTQSSLQSSGYRQELNK